MYLTGQHSLERAAADEVGQDRVAEVRPEADTTSAVVVQGDTRSAFEQAVHAYHNRIPLIHLEAGVRTWDLGEPYPEEGYRRMIDDIADLLLCPTNIESANIPRSRKSPRKSKGGAEVEVVGNPACEDLKRHIEPNVNRRDRCLITFHRAENRSNPARVKNMVEGVLALARLFPSWRFVWVRHVRGEWADKLEEEVRKIEPLVPANIQYVAPMSRKEFVYMLSTSSMCITDSGGVQEESPVLGTPVIVFRKVTDRPYTTMTRLADPDKELSIVEAWDRLYPEAPPTTARTYMMWPTYYPELNNSRLAAEFIQKYIIRKKLL